VSASRTLPVGFTPEAVARELILSGKAPDGLHTGELSFVREPLLQKLPRGLTVRSLQITECPNFKSLPEDLWAGAVVISACRSFRCIPGSVSSWYLRIADGQGDIQVGAGASLHRLVLDRLSGRLMLPERLTLDEFAWPRSPLFCLPEGWRAQNLDLSRSPNLVRLRSELSLDSLRLEHCRNLEQLPDRLEAKSVNLAGCVGLRWQEDALAEVGSLCLVDCRQITRLPD